jgi:hypothetical protein
VNVPKLSLGGEKFDSTPKFSVIHNQLSQKSITYSNLGAVVSLAGTERANLHQQLPHLPGGHGKYYKTISQRPFSNRVKNAKTKDLPL